MKVFTYGSLMFPRVWLEVTGRPNPCTEAVLHGFERRKIRDDPYPAILPSPNGSIRGKVYLDVDEETLVRLDQYEGAMYRRAPVTCRLQDGSNIGAFAYVISLGYEHLLEDADWNPEDFPA